MNMTLKLTGRALEIAEKVALSRKKGDGSVQIDWIFTDWLWSDYCLYRAQSAELQAQFTELQGALTELLAVNDAWQEHAKAAPGATDEGGTFETRILAALKAARTAVEKIEGKGNHVDAQA